MADNKSYLRRALRAIGSVVVTAAKTVVEAPPLPAHSPKKVSGVASTNNVRKRKTSKDTNNEGFDKVSALEARYEEDNVREEALEEVETETTESEKSEEETASYPESEIILDSN